MSDLLISPLPTISKSTLITCLKGWRISEALSLGDRVSILRQGRLAGVLDARALRSTPTEELRETIVRLMFGEEQLHVDIEIVARADRAIDGDGLGEVVAQRAAWHAAESCWQNGWLVVVSLALS